MKNNDDKEFINALKIIKNYCAKRDTAGKCFCCPAYGLCSRCFKGLPALWEIKDK